ncbi:hypothetical protein L895_05260 [Staphylococcus aureus SA16]|uniref:hypothetical protein n=1 Tax=Staphylococcus aureus TaxID=1280 RepID=UPI000386AB23|nr:hypothetical protein [Staphylococcus aureus]AVU08213.1 hypothetical protein B4893_05510 [Staphylococcus aureus]EPX93108.1 hypothetical protein L895_05260 [Staphylococcus aureus SA16]
MQVGVGPQQREIGSPIPTDNASWRGPNIEKLDHQFQQTMQVGVGPNTEAGEKSAYKNVQVGVGPNTEAGEKSAYKNVQVGVGHR